MLGEPVGPDVKHSPVAKVDPPRWYGWLASRSAQPISGRGANGTPARAGRSGHARRRLVAIGCCVVGAWLLVVGIGYQHAAACTLAGDDRDRGLSTTGRLPARRRSGRGVLILAEGRPSHGQGRAVGLGPVTGPLWRRPHDGEFDGVTQGPITVYARHAG